MPNIGVDANHAAQLMLNTNAREGANSLVRPPQHYCPNPLTTTATALGEPFDMIRANPPGHVAGDKTTTGSAERSQLAYSCKCSPAIREWHSYVEVPGDVAPAERSQLKVARPPVERQLQPRASTYVTATSPRFAHSVSVQRGTPVTVAHMIDLRPSDLRISLAAHQQFHWGSAALSRSRFES